MAEETVRPELECNTPSKWKTKRTNSPCLDAKLYINHP